MKKPRTSRRRALLGGTALLGCLGCQAVDAPAPVPVAPAVPAVRADSAKVIQAPAPIAMMDTLVPPVYKEEPGGYCGPSPLSATHNGRKMVCMSDSTLLACADNLTWRKEPRNHGGSMGIECAGNPLRPVTWGMLGFVGIDKAGPAPKGGRRLRPLA